MIWNIIKNSWLIAYKRLLKYPINAFSWLIADVSLYLSTFLIYFLLGTSINYFSTYSKNEVMLYIATGFIINNIYSIFFSEAFDSFSTDIWNGKIYYNLLKPYNIHLTYISKNINLKSVVSTPLLLLFWKWSMTNCSVNIDAIAVASIMLGAISMAAIFGCMLNLDLLGIRTDSFTVIVVQMLNIREKLDTIFPKGIGYFFTYVIPIFLSSAIPTRIILKEQKRIEIIWIILFPIICMVLNSLAIKDCLRNYDLGTEE